MPCPAFVRRAARFCLLLSLVCIPVASVGQAILHLQADTANLTAGGVLHLAVSSPLGAGTVVFLDGGVSLASVPLSSAGRALLGVAALARGPHTFSASLSSSAGSFASNTLQVTVAGAPIAFTFTANRAPVLPGQPLTFTTAGLPADAAGSLTFSDNGTSLGTVAAASPVPTYVAYGDGVTLGAGLPATQSYPGQLGTDLGLAVINRARPPFTTCDVLSHQILDYGDGPTQTAAPLTSLMPGENDTYDPNTLDTFQLCHQAALAWLATPREYKVLAGDAAIQATSGAWTPATFIAPTGNLADPATHTLFNATGSGTARIILTTDGGPVYLWYLLRNSNPAQFTLTLDGVPLPGTYGVQPPDYLLTTFGAGSSGFGLARLPAAAGTHTLDVTLLSGALGILGAGTPPGEGAASIHPTVLAMDIPAENNTCARDSAATLASYSAATQADAALLAADGLDVRFIPTANFFIGNPAEMADCALPNALGSRHLADAVEALLPALAPGAYGVRPGTPLTLTAALQIPGSRSVTADYTGDPRYAAAEASLAVTVLNPATATSLSASATTLPFDGTLTLAATVTATATPIVHGTLRFYESTGTDTNTVVTDGQGAATSLFRPAPGDHIYFAAYHSDDFHTDSLSPPLSVHVDGLAATLALTASPQHLAYGQQVHLTAHLSAPSCNGLLTFSDSLAGPLGSLFVAQGTGAIDVPALPGGTRLLSVAYTGDAICSPETSPSIPVLVDPLVPSLVTTPLNQPTYPQQQILHVDLLGHNTPAQPMLPGTLDPNFNSTSVFMGDSITQYWPLPTHNAGISGQTTTQMLARFAQDVLGHGYERVFILGGTNDFWHFDAPQDQVLGNLEAMAQMAAAAGIRPILCTVMPFFVNYVSQEYRVVPLNAAIMAFAAQNGFAVVDYHTALLNFPQYFPDGVHPADPGHALMETTLARTLLLPSGAVSLPDGTSATLSATGTANLTTGTNAGSFTASIAYSGDTSFLPATEAVSFTIARAATTTLLRAQPLASDTSTTVALSASVTNPSGLPTSAAVTFSDGAALLNTATLLPDGSATLATGKLSAGAHSFSAAYPGSGNFLPSNSPAIPLDVVFTSTSLALAAPALSFRTGAAIPLTATLTPAGLTGSITFSDSGVSLGQVALVNGVATLSTKALGTGTHSVSASFAGDSSTSPAQSPALTLTVAPAAATLTLAPLPTSMVYGSTFNLTASITPADASGQVTFTDGGQLIGQSNFVNGSASAPVTRPAVGPHSFAASYPGDSATQPAATAVTSFTVSAIPTTLTLTSSAKTIAFGAPSPTLNATLTPLNASGSVTLTDALTGASMTAALSNGAAAITLPALQPGTHTFTASYPGDNYDAPAASLVISVTVTQAVSHIVLAPPPASQLVTAPVTLSATITPATAGGTVLFRDATAGVLGQAPVANGSTTLQLTSLPAGAYSLTAVYSGDAQDLPATSDAVATQINLLPAALVLTGTASSPLGADIALTATATPGTLTGLVSFSDNGTPAGAVLLGNGAAILHTVSLGVGAHTLRVSFAGDSTHSPATSAPLQLTVVADTTVTTLSLAQPSVPVGAPILVNLGVISTLGNTPTGLVTVRSGAAVLGTATLSHASGNATYATLTLNSLSLGLGTFPLTASYPGDAQNSPSDSAAAPVTLTILPAPTTAALTLSTAVTALRTPLTLSAAVTADTGIQPVGSISFMAGAQTIATVPLSAAGTASTAFDPTTLGTLPLTAVYAPGSLFTASSAPLQTLTVTPPVALALSKPAWTTPAGGSLDETLTLTPLSGFAGAVNVTCTSPIFFITCSATAPPASLASPATATLHLTISPTLSGYQAASAPSSGINPSGISPAGRGLALACILFVVLPFRRQRRLLPGLVMMLGATAFLAGCATGPQDFDRIPAGVHTVHVDVTAAGLTQTVPITVTIQ